MYKPSKYELMRHALGVREHDGRYTKPYRNHFVAGDDDRPVWDELVVEGLAVRRAALGSVLFGDSPCYHVTPEGRDVALAGIKYKRVWGYGQLVNP